MSSTTTDATLTLDRATEFVARECSLADSHQYAEWLALWAESDCYYWVPARGNDPQKLVSVIYDNRARLTTRVNQLISGQHYAQAPTSVLARVVSGLTVVESEPHSIAVRGAFFLAEYRDELQTIWAGYVTYRLIEADGELRMQEKTVELINRDGWLPTLAFLI